MAIGYAAMAFATVSVASDFLPALRLPQWTVTFVAVATVVGFPIALIVAWLYDITPGGVRKAAPLAETAPVTAKSPPTRRDRAAGYIGIGMVISLVTVGAASQLDRLPFVKSDFPSIAVLPFENISQDPANEFFAAGMHEEVMTQLYRLGGLTVISRTSVMQYRGSAKPVRTVARELGVGSVLEASVRRQAERVRIDARLVDAATDQPIWADSYDRELSDALAIQAEIAQRIAEALHARLSATERAQLAATSNRTVSSSMYEVYLRGVYEAAEGNHEEAVETFQRALAIDPDYAPALAGMARSYYTLAFFGDLSPAVAFPAMRSAATRAIEIDPDLAEAHAALALYELHYDWNWKSADQRFRRALQLSPNHAQVRHDYAHYLLAVGRIDDSADESLRASELDPANSMLKACVGWHDFTNRQYDQALAQSMKALMMMPNAFWPEMIQGWAYQHKGQYTQAIAALRNAVGHSGGSAFAIASLAHAQATAGERTPARQLLSALLESSKLRYVSAYDLAVVHAGLGEASESFFWLRRAYEERAAMLVNIGWDPRFDAMRKDTRFVALVHDIKLPDRPEPKPAKPPARGKGM